MTPLFVLLALFTLVAAVGAVGMRNLVHCAMCVALTFVGVAMLFLQLGAQFVGLAQVLIYVGAIAILIVFAILLTRSSDAPAGVAVFSRSWRLGLLTATATLAAMVLAIARSPSLGRQPVSDRLPGVKAIGQELMSTYVLPLEVLGLLLTAALLGAAILARPERGDE